MVGGQCEGFVIFHKSNTTIQIYICLCIYLYVAHDCEMGFASDGYMQIHIVHILYQRILNRKTT